MKYLGNGIYTISEASTLTGIKKDTIRRWIQGYKYKSKTETKMAAPILNKHYESIEHKIALSFLDLIEIQFIELFRSFGVKWNVIKQSALIAEKLIKTSHPFATKKFFTDTKTVLLKIADESGNIDLIDLFKHQYTIDKIMEPILHECLDFDVDDLASRWWPLGKDGLIVVDPKRNFGKPTVESINIPTETIYSAYKAEKSIQYVAEWYEIDESEVARAIEFEQKRVA